MMNSRCISLFTILVCGLLPTGAYAAAESDKFPVKPIRIVVHVGPGGAADVYARALARAAEPFAGQPIIVENRPGGAGAAQMASLSHASPDGYTIGINTLTHLTGMLTNLKGLFSPTDFTWILQNQIDTHILLVNEDSPYQTYEQLVEGTKRSGRPLIVSGYGTIGSTAYIATHLFTQPKDIKFSWVSYGSSTDATSAMMGGHVQATVTNPGQAFQFIEAKRVRALGVLSPRRNKLLPQVPTFIEAGVSEGSNWYQVRGIYGPAGIPQDVQNALAEIFTKGMRDPNFLRYQEQAGLETETLGPKEYQQSLANQVELAKDALREAGVDK